MFNSKQIKYMQSIGLNVDFSNLTDSDYELIEEKVGIELQKLGFDSSYDITESGRICESILDALEV